MNEDCGEDSTMSNKTLKKLQTLTLDVNNNINIPEVQIQVTVDDFVEAYGKYIKNICTQNLIESLKRQYQSCLSCQDSMLIDYSDISFGANDVKPEEFEQICRTLIDKQL